MMSDSTDYLNKRLLEDRQELSDVLEGVKSTLIQILEDEGVDLSEEIERKVDSFVDTNVDQFLRAIIG